MKNFKKIMKTGCLSLCSILIIFELYVLINSNRTAEISHEIVAEQVFLESDEDLFEIYEQNIPMANFEIDEFDETETETEIEIETETEIETEIKIEDAQPDETEIFKSENKTEIDFNVNTTTEKLTQTEKETITETEIFENTETMPVLNQTEKSDAIIYQPTDLLSKNVPILMYHTSSENNPGSLAELYVKPSEFEKQIQYLAENGFKFCTFDDYYNLNNIDKPVFITFDDGYKENYTEIFPILKKYNAKITLFLTINNMAAENFTVEMIKEMSDSGLVKFESHTLNHPDLSVISVNETRLANELATSKTQIEEMTGKPVLAIAYPAGKYNDTVIAKAKEYYSFGLLAGLGIHNTEYNPFEIRRIRMNRSTSLNGFINYVG